MSNNDMEELRSQMNILTGKLARYDILSESAALQNVKRSMQKINSAFWRELVLFAIATSACVWMLKSLLGFPLWFVVVTAAYFTTALVYTVSNNRILATDNLSCDNLRDAARKAESMIRSNRRWLFIGIPLSLIWVVLFLWLMFTEPSLTVGFRDGALTGAIMGGIGGGLIGWLHYRRTQARLREFTESMRAFITDPEAES